jgi:hypothetical protein
VWTCICRYIISRIDYYPSRINNIYVLQTKGGYLFVAWTIWITGWRLNPSITCWKWERIGQLYESFVWIPVFFISTVCCINKYSLIHLKVTAPLYLPKNNNNNWFPLLTSYTSPTTTSSLSSSCTCVRSCQTPYQDLFEPKLETKTISRKETRR